MALPEHNEIIVAHSYDLAGEWAAERGWFRCNLSITGTSWIPGFTTAEGRRILFAGDPLTLEQARPGTKIHFGPFPSGIPAGLMSAANKIMREGPDDHQE